MAKAPTSKLRDMMGNASLIDSANATMTVVDRIQNIPDKGVRLIGLNYPFVSCCYVEKSN